MAIFKRGKFYWYEFTYDGKRIRESTQQGDKETAKTLMGAERSRLARVDAGLESPEPKPQAKSATVGDLLDELKHSYERDGKASAKNLSTIELARTAFGKIKAADLAKEHLESYIRDRVEKGRRNSTINRVTELLRRAYKVAELTPPKMRHLSEKDNVRKGFFSNEEFRRVYAQLPADIRDFALFGYLTGWRKGEIASLTWYDVEENVIRLRGENSKNREPRSVVIAGELVELIERRKQARPVNNTLTKFVFHRDGQQVREFRKTWASACVAAGLGKMVCRKCGTEGSSRRCSRCKTTSCDYTGRLVHDLRRSAVRSMVRSGVPQSVAMKISGHKTASMFRRYDIANEEDLRAALESVQRYHDAEAQKIVTLGSRSAKQHPQNPPQPG